MTSPLPERISSTPQQIRCEGNDSRNSYNLFGTDIEVYASNIDPTESNTASNKVKVSQISKFEWEEKYYIGNLVSCNNTYIAYVLPAKKNDDHVRVINLHTSMRVLLRGFKKKVVDLCFEALSSNLLACVDLEGTLFIFEIFEEDGNVKSKNVLTIYQDEITNSEIYRIVWSPKVPSSIENVETILAFSSDTQAHVYDLKRIRSAYPNMATVKHSEIKYGIININCHSKAITSLAVSPDVQVLATCSLDGNVKFWSLDFNDPNSVNCIHEWEPHNGDPVTCLFFCDNLLVVDDSSPFWRYLITGTAHNSVLKIWCAVKWVCIQTIIFKDYIDSTVARSMPCMKVLLDLSAKYLIISDIYRKVLYICRLHQDKEKDRTSIVSISEFILKEPQLSFSIYSAKVRKKNEDFGDASEELNGEIDDESSNQYDNDNDKSQSCVIHLFAIQKSALQKLSIKFKVELHDEHAASCLSIATSSQDDILSMQDVLSDVDYYISSDGADHALNDLLNDKLENNVLDSRCSESTICLTSHSNSLAFAFEMKSNELSNDTFYNTSNLDSVCETVETDEKQLAKIKSMENINFVGSSEMSPDISMSQILEMLQNQQKLISSQQQELREMKDMMKLMLNHQLTQTNKESVNHESNDRDDLKVYVQLLQKSATSHFNKACKEFNKSCSERLEQAIKELTTESQAKQDRTSQMLNQIVTGTIAAKLEKNIKQDMKQVIQPALEKMHSKYLESVNSQIAQKLSIWERTFREETQEFMKSKNFIESITCAAAGALEGTIPTTYRESFQNILIPGFEKASMAMYMQINQTFQQGTKQYLEKLEGHLETKRQKQEDKIEPLVATLREIINKFHHTTDRLSNPSQVNFDDIQLTRFMERLQQGVTKTIEVVVVPAVTNIISQCTSHALGQWKTKEDEISTPEDADTKKKRIDKCIENKDFTEAFNIALHADDLSVVVYACTKVDPSDLFLPSDEPFPQDYILSLIQQLSIDLNQDTEIKTKYLEESIMALKPSDDVTKDYMPTVLQGLNEMLNETIESLHCSEPTSKQIKPLKMLLMASRSLLQAEQC